MDKKYKYYVKAVLFYKIVKYYEVYTDNIKEFIQQLTNCCANITVQKKQSINRKYIIVFKIFDGRYMRIPEPLHPYFIN